MGIRYCPKEYRGVVEMSPIKCVTTRNVRQIIDVEFKYGNHHNVITRTRGFLSHKRSSAQGVKKRVF